MSFFFFDFLLGDTNIVNDSSRLAIDAQPLRRHSDSDATKRPDSATSDNNDSPAQIRRVSIDSTESKSATAGISSANVSIGDLVKCRNPKCDASASPAEAKRTYKNCHNCKLKQIVIIETNFVKSLQMNEKFLLKFNGIPRYTNVLFTRL